MYKRLNMYPEIYFNDKYRSFHNTNQLNFSEFFTTIMTSNLLFLIGIEGFRACTSELN